jgi:hypothetical protein
MSNFRNCGIGTKGPVDSKITNGLKRDEFFEFMTNAYCMQDTADFSLTDELKKFVDKRIKDWNKKIGEEDQSGTSNEVKPKRGRSKKTNPPQARGMKELDEAMKKTSLTEK